MVSKFVEWSENVEAVSPIDDSDQACVSQPFIPDVPLEEVETVERLGDKKRGFDQD